MPLVTAKVRTWICDKYPLGCQHKWQFSGEAVNASPHDLTEDQLRVQFPQPQFAGLQPGKCPECYSRGVSSDLAVSLDPVDMSIIYVASDEELESRQVDEFDSDGQAVMVESGEYRDVLINDNWTPRFIQEPIMAPKQRQLTDEELADLKLQRDQNLDQLETITVQEVTP